MKIAIVGAGAMGSLFGALLAEGDGEVWLLDVWKDHVRAIRKEGLGIERPETSASVTLHATTDPDDIGRADLVMVFVKSTQTAAAAETAAKLAGDTGYVLTLQNGMGNADIISEAVDPRRVMAGTTSHGATLLGPGRIRHAGIGPTVIGMWHEDGDPAVARRMAARLSAAGIATEAVDEVRRIVWDKLLVNVGINAITALTGIRNGELLDLEATRAVSAEAVQEAVAVARAQGIPVRSDAVAHVYEVARATAANRSSMGQDVDNARQTEIDAINGVVVRDAERLGLQAPVNRVLTGLIQTVQAHYSAER